MQDFTRGVDTAPVALLILELVRELTVGQRKIDTAEHLSAFLHTFIFPKLGPFYIEIYFPDNLSGNFLPCHFEAGKVKNTPETVPAMIHGDQPIIGLLAETHSPVELSAHPQSPAFLGSPKNDVQLLVPIQEESELFGLLYVGSGEPGSFPAEFLTSIKTIAAVIGSRLKSMGTIIQLKKSMHELEYSDRLRTALYEISEQTHSSENINDLYGKLHQQVGRLIHARNFFIALEEKRPDGQYIKFPYYIDQNDTHFQNMELKLEGRKYSITGYLLKSRQPLLLTPTNFERICREQNIECVGTRPYSWLGAPFFFDHISGVVAIQSYNRVVYTEKDKELMAFVARHIGDALNRKRSVDALQKAKERAERAEKNKSTFLANMSHEIRTPMNGILGLTELVLHSDITGQKRDYLEMVHASAERLLKLINNILDFSKIEAGKLELDIAPFSLRGTIAEALEILAISAAKKDIHLSVDCDETIPDLLLGDAGKLSQVLINLVGNAIKFTNKGKVTLSVHQQKLHGKQNAFFDLHFQVRDTGIGIPNAKIKNIFKAFTQVVTTRDSAQRGTGLGLVIAGELVEMMGGKICVESKAGIGTTFYFTVGFAPGATPSTLDTNSADDIAKRQAEEKSRAQPRHILLVEDEYINRTLAVTVLEREGWKVTTAENGLQALDILRDTVFDLILMDIQMPELDGYATTRAIRRQEQKSGRHVPIIAMTAYAVRGDREKCLASGMDGYLSKPVRSDKLIEEIETVLRSNL
jgi:signal transduction histidine kinase/ActR/RegA family two-component response regulator